MDLVKTCMCWNCQVQRDEGFGSIPGHDGDRVSGTRDDLIRLVVGMQWREMCSVICLIDIIDPLDDDGGYSRAGPLPDDAMPLDVAASTIVDEWLGVR